jgi:Flp pilus assembly protein TadB
MTAASLLAALLVGVGLAGIAHRIKPPTTRLAGRLRPYAVTSRGSLAGPAQLVEVPATFGTAAVGRLFGPPLIALARLVGRLFERSDDDRIALRLHQAGLADATPDDYRLRVVASATIATVAFGATGAVLRAPALIVGLAALGAGFGVSRVRGRVDRAIDHRRRRMRSELATVNQLLALQLRTGAGPVQAVQRLVDRGRGVVVEELREVLTWIRSGLGETDAFRRAAEITPEPSAARSYLLFAAGAERGADLAGALLALSADLRDARREELRQLAVKRRAAMLLPTIGILAPIMLLFIAAPLPSVVFGIR